jgi:uncharacterized glyoxalase superfamily protein PhnB
MLMRWKDSPDKSMCTPSNENNVMHSCPKIGETRMMVSDGRNTGQPKFDGFALSLDVKTDAEAQTLFKTLSDGGRTHAVDLVLIAPQMLAGMEAGWTQSFDKLQELAAGG